MEGENGGLGAKKPSLDMKRRERELKDFYLLATVLSASWSIGNPHFRNSPGGKMRGDNKRIWRTGERQRVELKLPVGFPKIHRLMKNIRY